jgi:hypothetical protein
LFRMNLNPAIFAMSGGGTGAAGPSEGLLVVVILAFVVAGILWIVNRKQLDEIAKADKAKHELPKVIGSIWKCPHCGEEVDPEFSECWKCGTKREKS